VHLCEGDGRFSRGSSSRSATATSFQTPPRSKTHGPDLEGTRLFSRRRCAAALVTSARASRPGRYFCPASQRGRDQEGWRRPVHACGRRVDSINNGHTAPDSGLHGCRNRMGGDGIVGGGQRRPLQVGRDRDQKPMSIYAYDPGFLRLHRERRSLRAQGVGPALVRGRCTSSASRSSATATPRGGSSRTTGDCFWTGSRSSTATSPASPEPPASAGGDLQHGGTLFITGSTVRTQQGRVRLGASGPRRERHTPGQVHRLTNTSITRAAASGAAGGPS
jgi:hypothetical protein